MKDIKELSSSVHPIANMRDISGAVGTASRKNSAPIETSASIVSRIPLFRKHLLSLFVPRRWRSLLDAVQLESRSGPAGSA